MKKDNPRRLLYSLAVFLIAFAICATATAGYVSNKSAMEYAKMEQLILTQSNKVNNVITKLLYKTQTLSALVIQNNGNIKDFERVAATIIDDPCIRNVILAPGGVVSNVYPLEGNEQVVGLDYFAEGDGNREAAAAKETGQMVLGGPFTLVQGGQALVGRLPVYLGNDKTEKSFWGLVSVTLNYPQALDGAELEALKSQNLAYEIWRISPDTNERQIIASSNYVYNRNARYVEQPMKILNAEWYFRLSPVRAWYQYPETWIFTLMGLLISILFSYLVQYNYDLRRIQGELENLTFNDALTGALNRRGLFRRLGEMTAGGKTEFTLCYLDLDNFKQINDVYGHNVGDQVLVRFADAFQKRLKPHHIFGRIGGDEFLLIAGGGFDEKELVRLIEEVRQDIEQNKETEAPVSFSWGKTVCRPGQEADIDSLIAAADSDMYTDKSRNKTRYPSSQ